MSGRENVFKRGVYDLGPMSGASRDCVWITGNPETTRFLGQGSVGDHPTGAKKMR